MIDFTSSPRPKEVGEVLANTCNNFIRHFGAQPTMIKLPKKLFDRLLLEFARLRSYKDKNPPKNEMTLNLMGGPITVECDE